MPEMLTFSFGVLIRYIYNIIRENKSLNVIRYLHILHFTCYATEYFFSSFYIILYYIILFKFILLGRERFSDRFHLSKKRQKQINNDVSI